MCHNGFTFIHWISLTQTKTSLWPEKCQFPHLVIKVPIIYTNGENFARNQMNSDSNNLECGIEGFWGIYAI